MIDHASNARGAPQHSPSTIPISRQPRLLLTVPEVCSALRVSRSQVYILAAHGALEMVHIGRLCRIPIESVEGYVRELRMEVQTRP
jgi:excisionase family DNA binding protein